jgi:preflagellin peptidase FlaK
MLTALRLICCAAGLGTATYMDLRTREISNWVWLGMATCGIAILVYESFTEGNKPVEMLGIPLMFGFAILFNVLGMLAGADAKALMTLSLVLPKWPAINSFPIFITQIPFPFVAFMNSVLLVLPLILFLAVYNILKGHREIPFLFFGFKVPLEKAARKWVWPIEMKVEGKRKLLLVRNKDNPGIIDDYRRSGEKEIWITEELPYALFLLIGLIISCTAGDLIGYGIFSLLV